MRLLIDTSIVFLLLKREPHLKRFIPVDADSIGNAEQLIADKEDAPFLALAIKLGIPIWSNDLHFKGQSAVKVYTMSELQDLLGA